MPPDVCAGDDFDDLAVCYEEERIREASKQVSASTLVNGWIDAGLALDRCKCAFYGEQELRAELGPLLFIPCERRLDVILGILP